MSYPVAEILDQRGIPFAFVTGYQSPSLIGRWRDHLRCEKPCTPADILALIDQALKK